MNVRLQFDTAFMLFAKHISQVRVDIALTDIISDNSSKAVFLYLFHAFMGDDLQAAYFITVKMHLRNIR